MYDIIGDIHGHADELEHLLRLMGYHLVGGVFHHSERKAVFLGDFIDRGPKIRQVLEIVRPMVDDGAALAVMGNHELNALAFHTADPSSPGKHLRDHSPKNVAQHRATLDQLSAAQLEDYLAWFKNLPMWLELEGLRAAHACWDEAAIKRIASEIQRCGGITSEFLSSACRPIGELFAAVETILKGKEARLPDGMSFADKDGHHRTEIRTRWYLPADGHTYATYALQSDNVNCDILLERTVVACAVPYPPSAKPVFVGHYWLSAPRPAVLAQNVACLDYSVAKQGFLCAYRWNGEQTLTDENFV